jgi:hypothetical protein
MMKAFAMIETNVLRQNKQMPEDSEKYHPLSITPKGAVGALNTAW